MPQALLFGSIGVLAETSALQRNAFNTAFAEAGLDWHWDERAYRGMLASSGGQQRIENYAKDRDEAVDAEALHQAKSDLFQKSLDRGLPLRRGVRDLIEAAKARDIPIGFVTTTSANNVRAILKATGTPIETFAFIGHRDLVRIPKPSAEIYKLALGHIGVHAADALAIEDSATSARAALAAGVPTVGFPGEMHEREDFGDVTMTTRRLDPEALGFGSASARAVA